MEELIDKLRQLRGLVLMHNSGKLYVLSDYEVIKDAPIEERGWFKKTIRKVTYLRTLTTNIDGKLHNTYFTYLQVEAAKVIVNSIIEDRNRYLTMLRSLNAHGLAVKKKHQSGTTNQIGETQS